MASGIGGPSTMMDGKSKAQLLLSLLGSEGRGVLEKLSKASAQLLTTSIDNLPIVTTEMKLSVLRETQSMAGNSSMANDDPFSQTADLGDAFTDESGASFDEIPSAIQLEQNDHDSEPLLASESDSPVAAQAPAIVPNSNYAEIGASLAKQRPQVIAFILSRLDETMKASVQRHIPADILASAQSKSLEMIPMSEKVYQKIYESVFKNLN